MSDDSGKRVNLVVPTNAETIAESSEMQNSSQATPVSTYSPPRRTTKSDDVLIPEPTFSEKFMRYLVIVIYLGGLSSIGFILSMYYIFFWDSRMPPVYKPTKKPPTFLKP